MKNPKKEQEDKRAVDIQPVLNDLLRFIFFIGNFSSRLQFPD